LGFFGGMKARRGAYLSDRDESDPNSLMGTREPKYDLPCIAGSLGMRQY
jgi:hypothetical protein